jgi:hypothetical protein
MQLEEVTDGEGLVLAVFISSLEELPDTHTFPTDHLEELQLGLFKHRQGHEIKKHYHPSLDRSLKFTTEVLIILSGIVSVDIYDNSNELVATRESGPNSIILLRRGGHGFSILKEAIIIEVKQGPYAGINDKILF